MHRLTMDTYTLQHPGKPYRQSIQSINTHLISLYLVLEKNLKAEKSLLGRFWNMQASLYGWSRPLQMMTVMDIVKAKDFSEHQGLFNKWGRNVWNAWSGCHHIVKGFFI